LNPSSTPCGIESGFSSGCRTALRAAMVVGTDETRRLFECLEEAEEAPSSNEPCWTRDVRVLSSEGARRQQQRNVALAAGLGLLALACVGFAVARPRVPSSAVLSGVQLKVEGDGIGPFQQCGGQGWTNGTCCKKGCACVVETKYYSQCKAPEGLQNCNDERAKVEAEAARTRVDDRKADLDQWEDTLSAAKRHLKKATEERKEAEEKAEKARKTSDEKSGHLQAEEDKAGVDLQKVESVANTELDKVMKEAKDALKEATRDATELRDGKLKVARDARAKALDSKNHRRSVYEKADKDFADKVKERNETKALVDKHEKEEKVRKEKTCPGVFGACTASDCCTLGCQPYWQNQYFCQCEGPNHAKWCNAEEQMKIYTKSTHAMPGLTKDVERLDKANATAAKESKKADDEYDTVAKKAEHDINAAEEEFKVSTKKPRAKADEKIGAAKEKALKAITEAKDIFDNKTAKARAAATEAKDAKDSAEKTAKAKRRSEDSAHEDVQQGVKDVAQAKAALASAKSAVRSWERAASGNFCGQDDDATHLDF